MGSDAGAEALQLKTEAQDFGRPIRSEAKPAPTGPKAINAALRDE